MSGVYEQNGDKPWSLMHCTESNCLKAMCKLHRPIKKRQQKTLGWHQQGFKVKILEGQSLENPQQQNETEGNGSIVKQGWFSGGAKILPILQSGNLEKDGPEDDVQLESNNNMEENPDRFDLMDGAEDDEIERAREASDAESEDSLDDKLVIDLSTLNPEEDQKMEQEANEAVDGVDKNVYDDDKRPSSPFSNCTTISSLSFSTDDEISQALKCKPEDEIINQDGCKTEEKIDVEEDNQYEHGVEFKDVKLVVGHEHHEFPANPNDNENLTEPMDIDENPVIVQVIDVFPAVRKSQRLLQKFKITDEVEGNAKAKRSRWHTRHCKDCDDVATR